MDPSTTDSTDPQKLGDKVNQACEEQLKREMEQRVLVPIGLTTERLWANASSMPAETLTEILSEMGRVNLGCEFLLAGIDDRGVGHLMYIDGISAPKSLDDIGFWAIGSGTYSAISSLAFHADRGRVNRFKSLSSCIYHLCEAKFMAESARTVGKKTFVTVFEHGKKPRLLSDAGVERIREAWERSGAPRVPEGILSDIPALLWDPGEPESPEQLAAIFGGRADLAQRLLKGRNIKD